MKHKPFIIKIESIFTDHPFLVKYITVENMGQFCRYIVVGLISFSLEYSLFYISFQYFKWWYVLAHMMSLIPVFWLNFILNRLWSFRSREKLGRQLSVYGILFVFNIFISDLLIFWLAGKLLIDPRWAKLMVMAVIILWNFILYKRVIYKR